MGTSTEVLQRKHRDAVACHEVSRSVECSSTRGLFVDSTPDGDPELEETVALHGGPHRSVSNLHVFVAGGFHATNPRKLSVHGYKSRSLYLCNHARPYALWTVFRDSDYLRKQSRRSIKTQGESPGTELPQRDATHLCAFDIGLLRPHFVFFVN